ncbi:MAG: response regulator [Bacteroidota bacterium]
MRKQVIICVDDEPIILDSLLNQLQSLFGEEYIYEVAENALDALELIEEMKSEGFTIKTVISDYLMPGMKGDDFMIQLNLRYPLIQKVMLTGHMDENTMSRTMRQANLTSCIRKPWTQQQLFSVLRG